MTPVVGKKIFVGQLIAGQQLHDIFLVSRKTLAETKTGKPYLALGLMDKTGEIEARLWENAHQFAAQAEEGSFVLVQAIAKPFRDQLQLGISSLQRVAEDTVQLGDYMPTSARPPAEMAAELDAVIAGIGNPAIQALIQAIFQGETLARFQRAPAAKKMHHAYIGGLIEHTLSIVGMAEKTAAHYPLLDRDLLIAGALLHDIAKIEEFDFARPPFGYTDRGRLVGHLVLGVEMVRKAAESVAELTTDQVDQLMHIILSHHGQFAYGSPVLPMTPEAILLHHLDDMDAKMNFMEGLRAKMAGTGQQWSDYQRHLERYLYLRAGGNEDESADSREEVQEREAPPQPEPTPPSRSSKVVPQRQQTLF
ncbi:MAG: HD domain-containing protein [Desulfobulbaceae bacterium]|nr:HD domain-containing protein [Desulfobulbaceae bacterium]